MAPNGHPKPLRIGIVGAGLVGSATALALSRLPNVSVSAFEQSPIPREAGAWISLTPTGIKVLNNLIPHAELTAICYRPPPRGAYVTRHWRTGEVLVLRSSSESLRDEYHQARTHRHPLLKLILGHLPVGAVQYGRKVTSVDLVEGSGEVELTFDGDKTEKFDLLVTADGIYSKIRRHFFPEHVVGYKGAVAYRTIFHKALLDGIEGLHDDSGAWRADTDVVFLSEVGLDMYGVVIIRPESQEFVATLAWERSIGPKGVQRLRDFYKDWDPIISRVLERVEDMQAYPLDSGPWLKQLVLHDRIAFVGDAAHPTAGAYGAGAAMGHGDAWALYRALQATSSGDGMGSYDVPRALRIFQQARLPFLMRVEQQMAVDVVNAGYVRQAGGRDEDEWIRRFRERNAENQWLTEHDVELEVQMAVMGETLWDRK
ncbi:salicylate hydroxylase [Apodospora peruviana]|uniref:Salicylate hydroxylase n=1 Tax=Apodospora peruviana TaxID=516989 RepID=A0AAE0M4S0_9PEZI|nr:salicylate hydroxylase [Apodospora peruviana]